MTIPEFFEWEKATRDTIDVKRRYLDLAGDLVAGVLLSQIVYWHLPDKTGRQRLRVEAGGHKWLAKERDAWWEECRITPRQVDRALARLEERRLIVTCIRMFAGKTVKHLRIDWDVFLPALGTASVCLPRMSNGCSTNGQRPGYRAAAAGIDKASIPPTETPAQTTQRAAADPSSPAASPQRLADPVQRVGIINARFAADLERRRAARKGSL